MRGHRRGRAGKRLERQKVSRGKFGAARLDPRQLQMAVAARAAVPRDVLDHRQHAAGEKAFDDGAAEVGDLLRPASVGPRPDHRMGELIRDVEHGRAIDGDSDLPEIVRDEFGNEFRRLEGDGARKLLEKTRRRGIGRPLGGPRRCTRPPS